MKKILLAGLLMISLSAAAQEADSALAIERYRDSVRVAELATYSIYPDMRLAQHIIVNATTRIELMDIYDAKKMRMVMKSARMHFAPGEIHQMPNNGIFVSYDTLEQSSRLFVFDSALRYFFVYASSDSPKRFDFRGYFKATEKCTEVIDSNDPVAGQHPAEWVFAHYFGITVEK
jgi:hypothetical protein